MNVSHDGQNSEPFPETIICISCMYNSPGVGLGGVSCPGISLPGEGSSGPGPLLRLECCWHELAQGLPSWRATTGQVQGRQPQGASAPCQCLLALGSPFPAVTLATLLLLLLHGPWGWPLCPATVGKPLTFCLPVSY